MEGPYIGELEGGHIHTAGQWPVSHCASGSARCCTFQAKLVYMLPLHFAHGVAGAVKMYMPLQFARGAAGAVRVAKSIATGAAAVHHALTWLHKRMVP